MTAGYIAVDGGQIYYRVFGDGTRTIVWVHGLPLNGEAWCAQVDYFAAHYRNVVIDLRGYGRSSKVPAGVESVTDRQRPLLNVQQKAGHSPTSAFRAYGPGR